MTPEKHHHYIERYIYLIIFLVSVLFIGLSQWLTGGTDEFFGKSLFISLLKDTGIAGIVAVIIIFTVEKSSRENYMRAAAGVIDNINRDLFRAIYKRYFPEALFVEVEKCLLKSDFYRKGYRIYYQISLVDPALDDQIDMGVSHLSCMSQTRYQLVNSTLEEAEFECRLLLERPINRAWERYCSFDEIQIGGKILTSQEIADATNKDDEHIIFSYKVNVPVGDVGITISTKAHLIKQKTDSEIWVFLVPSDGAELHVSTPNCNLEVRANANHSHALEPIVCNSATKSWSLPYGIFPHQSLVFWWTPREDAPPMSRDFVTPTEVIDAGE